VAIGLNLPPVKDRISWRLDELKTRIFYVLYPPEKAVFVPGGKVATAVLETAVIPSLTPKISPSQSLTEIQSTTEPTRQPTPESTPLPPAVGLKGIRYIDQHGAFNYCAPANLAMELSYWGWGGTREDAGKYLKPNPEDYNVMLYEMVNYVREKTNLLAALRYGGTLDLLKKLVAAGYPVLIEKGAYIRDLNGKVSWMGHYNVVTGYDDAAQQVIVQDSYFTPNYKVPYDLLIQEWRSFNYGFIVVYPPEKETAVMGVLGDYAGEDKSNQIAAQTASEEAISLNGVEKYFALFNQGTSLVSQLDYTGASDKYDQAFALYPSLQEDKRPFRMMWYQTGPYFAYYYAGRYQDVIDLATTTLKAMQKPYLEESYYWRARAENAVGDEPTAVEDLCKSLVYHPNFPPTIELLGNLGATCP
jgi:tetratricopeptide (TPR) repeat protein